MGKKIAVVVPVLVLLLGGGTWALVDSNDAAPARAEVPQLAVAAIATKSPAERGGEPPAPATLRSAVAAANDLAPDADTATLVVRALWQHDGSPAAGIGISVTPQQPRLRLFERGGLTGDDGSIVLRGIRPASYAVDSPYGDVSSCKLAAGSVTTIDLAVRRDAFVRGIVLDGDDRPVPDARLWLSDRATWRRGFEMARSDANGRFELPLRGDHYVGARKAGYAPSRLRCLWPVPTSDVTLRLTSLGGAIRGRVLSTGGAPIAGAVVEVGQHGGHVVPGGTIGERYLQPTPEALRTDANGGFFADGVAGGSTQVLAWADGHGSVLQHVSVAIGRTSDVVLTLPRAATIEGTVRDDRQRPVANASVSVGDYGQFGSVGTKSDEHGRFRLEHVSPGTVEVLAALDPAHAFTTLQLAPGQVAACNPVLGTRQLAGTLVGPSGAPIAGYEIGTFADRSPVESATTDAAGRFTLAGMRGATVDLVVSLRGMGIAQRNGVAVDETDLVLRLTDAEMPSATIRGRIVDEQGNGLPKTVNVMNAATSFATRVEASLDGTFVCDALPAGTWWLSIDGHPLGRVRLPPVAVSAGENRALDDVVLSPPGRVELVLRGADVSSGGLVMFVRDDGTETYVMSPDGTRVAGWLTRGGYTAMTQVGDLAGAVSFTVHSGKTTHGELVLALSVPIAVEFRCEPSPKPGETLRTVARDAAGNVVAAGILDFRLRQPDGTPRLRFRVPPGPCVLDARHSDGRSATTAFTATSAGAGEQAVVVQLPSK